MRGKLVHSQNLILDFNREIQEFKHRKTQCLGIKESEGIQYQHMKERLNKEYTRRLRMILKTELNAKNKITAIGASAVPVLKYSFGTINWTLEEIRKIYRKTRKVLQIHKIHNPKAHIDRLYVKRKKKEEACYQLNIQSRDNQYFRTFEHKIDRRPACNYC